MEKNSRTEMLPGSGIFTAAVKHGIAPHSGSNFKITLRLLYGL